MARSELRVNMKFKRLMKRLDLPAPYVIGLLECMWQVGYQSGSDLIGDAEDVELAAEWPGESGRFFTAIKAEWLDERGGKYYIHDLYDHAPEYVKKKMDRRKSIQTTQNKDLQQNSADNGGQHPPNVGSTQYTQPNTPNPTQRPPPNEDSAPPGFVRWWCEYPAGPRKKNRAGCLRKWRRQNLEPIAEKIIAGLQRWKQCHDWTKDGGQFVPGAEVFINQSLWETDPTTGGGMDDEFADQRRGATPADAALAYGEQPK